jgi:hypothetical protein
MIHSGMIDLGFAVVSDKSSSTPNLHSTVKLQRTRVSTVMTYSLVEVYRQLTGMYSFYVQEQSIEQSIESYGLLDF